MATTIERVLAAITITDPGCWVWPYTKPSGYGYITANGKGRLVHRVVYTELVGPIPEGKEIDHLCRNRACCNPDHLEAVSRQTNMQRAHYFHANNRRNPTDLNSREIGSILNLVPESVNKLCREGAFDGAYQGGMGGIWFVPEASFDAYMAKRLAETLQAQKVRARSTLSNHKPSKELGQGWSITFTQVVERTRYTVADSLEQAIATAQREGVKAHGPTFQILSIDPI